MEQQNAPIGVPAGMGTPTLRALSQADVNRVGQYEVLWQPLYDIQTYPAAGTTQLDFFQVRQGQSGKTFSDTNMQGNGLLPWPKNELVVGIQVLFFPGLTPSATGTALTVNNFWNDVYAVLRTGNLQLFIGSKEYLVDAPIMVFPPSFRLSGVAESAITTTVTATTNQITSQYATSSGIPYRITQVRLVPNQNFQVSLRWPEGVVATPSTTAARIGVRLMGWEYRLSQ